MTALLDLELSKNALVVLIGPSGAGKSTLARTWPASQVLSLDALRGAVSDDFSNKTHRGSIRQTRCLVAAGG